jgi:adenosine deaminase
MIGITRSWSTEVAEATARFAAERRGDGVVALGLAGPGLTSHEEHRRFAGACAITRAAGLAVVPHAGLLEGADNVRLALEVLAPARIAHGMRAAETASSWGVNQCHGYPVRTRLQAGAYNRLQIGTAGSPPHGESGCQRRL